MNNIQHQEAVKKAVKKQFRGRSTLNSKSTPLYPDNAEREYQRIAAAYVRLLNKSLKDHLPEIMAEYKVQRNDGVRNDDLRDLESWLRRKFQDCCRTGTAYCLLRPKKNGRKNIRHHTEKFAPGMEAICEEHIGN